MKTEFLKAMNLTEEQIGEIMRENGKDIEAVKTKFADYDTLKTGLSEANTAIESFKSMDIEGIKRAAEDWKTKAEEAERNAAEQIAAMQFQGLLDREIAGAKGKNAKAIGALLDMDTLKQSKNQETELRAALAAVKEQNGYLFEQDSLPPPYAAGTGTPPPTGDSGQFGFQFTGIRPHKESTNQ